MSTFSRRPTTLLMILGVLVLIGSTMTVYIALKPASTPAEVSPSPAQASATSPSPSWNPSAGDAGDEDLEHGPAEVQESRWSPVVDHFAQNFTRVDGGAKKWRQRLIGPDAAPYVTPAVAEQLETVDIRNVPQGHFESYEILESSSYSLAVGLHYKEGWGLVLYLVTDGVDWQINAYDKWER